mgnify:CR=1 FL=1
MDYGKFRVGLAGGSASGKTSFVRALQQEFSPNQLAVISQDNYYKPLSQQERDSFGQVNFDRPEGVDFERVTKEKTLLFADVSGEILGNIEHVESGYVDFKREPLIPHMFSKRGPGLAVGDVNGDGNEDLFIGGSKGNSGKLFLNKNYLFGEPY